MVIGSMMIFGMDVIIILIMVGIVLCIALGTILGGEEDIIHIGGLAIIPIMDRQGLVIIHSTVVVGVPIIKIGRTYPTEGQVQ